MLQRLPENSLFVKVEKFEFHLSFLGHIIGQGSVQMDPPKVAGVFDWPFPESWKKCSVSWILPTFTAGSLGNYNSVAAPLTNLTSMKRSLSCTPEADTAFRFLKERFTSAPILQVPDASLQFVVEADTFDIWVGAPSLCLLLPLTDTSRKELRHQELQAARCEAGPGRVATLSRGSQAAAPTLDRPQELGVHPLHHVTKLPAGSAGVVL